MTDTEKAKAILASFPGRSDCYGMGRGACIKEPLTEAVISRHITGRERIGRYPLRRDGRIGVLAVDMDQRNLNSAIEYCDRCQHYWITAHIERSKSKGHHVWWFFKTLVPARKARLVASYILDECDLLGSVEIFPKQDFLGHGRYGNYINLPEFGADVRRGRTVFLNPDTGYRPYRDQWALLASITRVSESQLDKVIELSCLYEQTPSGIRDKAKVVTDSKSMGLPCFSRMLRQGVDEGMRNEAALRLSVGLYRTGIPGDLGLLMLREWNQRNRPPLDESELEKAVSNGYSGAYGHGCFSGLIQRFCDPRCPIFRRHNPAAREVGQMDPEQR